MKIGIMGSTDVGRAMGCGFAELGHEVKIGARNPNQEKLKSWLVGHQRTSAGSFAEAAAFGELVVLATGWDETEEAIKLAGSQNFSGKVVLDVTNPLDFAGGKRPEPATGQADSGGERIQRWLPGTKVVKAFNMIGNTHMFRPNFEDGQPDMFICGNDQAAKKEVTAMLADFGWPVVDLGPIDASRYLEPLAMGWITHGLNRRCSESFCASSRCPFLPFCLDTSWSQAQTA